MSVITTRKGVKLPESAFRFEFSRSGGPGGQHVNTSSSKVRAVLNLEVCNLDDDSYALLVAAFGSEVAVTCSEERSQLANRRRAVERICEQVDRALIVPKDRRATRPHTGAVERRLDDKRRRSEQKRSRQERDW
jgi:ribosome-associated protein